MDVQRKAARKNRPLKTTLIREDIHTVVSFTAETDLSVKKEEFLSRESSKHRVVPMIRDELREREYHTTALIGSHVSTRHREMVRASI